MQDIRFGINELGNVLKDLKVRKYLLVTGHSFQYSQLKKEVENIQISHIHFDDFTSNPLHKDIDKGTSIFIKENCDAIVGIGGGSALDVAKCIKLDSGRDIPLIAIPTTAGTGSESTQYIVAYRNGEKESLGNLHVVPNYVIFEPSVLGALSDYQKKSTLFDAFSQAIESWWSINSTEESIVYSKEAITLIMQYSKLYIQNDPVSFRPIMIAANLSGKAINITQTTAPHAMSYKLTSIFGIAHGHSVALCLPVVWDYMNNHFEKCIDARGSDYLKCVFTSIAESMQCNTIAGAIKKYRDMIDCFGLSYPVSADRYKDVETLSSSVNPTRLKNNPIELDVSTIRSFYEEIIK